jgi:hypothetical protein
MEFNVLCPEGEVCNYPFEKPCRTNMPLDFRLTLTAVHERNVRRQDLDMITDTTGLEDFNKILRGREGVLEDPETKNSPQISNLRGLDAILTHFSQEHEQTPYPTIKTHYRPSDSVLGGLYIFSPTASCPKIF